MTSGLQITEPSSEFWSLWWQCQAGGDSWVLSGDSDVSISGSWHHHMSRVKSGVTGAPAVTVWTMQGWSPPLMRPGSTPAHYWGSTRSRCRPTFVRGNIIWVRPSKYQQKPSHWKCLEVGSEKLDGHFIIFISPFFAGHHISARWQLSQVWTEDCNVFLVIRGGLLTNTDIHHTAHHKYTQLWL